MSRLVEPGQRLGACSSPLQSQRVATRAVRAVPVRRTSAVRGALGTSPWRFYARTEARWLEDL